MGLFLDTTYMEPDFNGPTPILIKYLSHLHAIIYLSIYRTKKRTTGTICAEELMSVMRRFGQNLTSAQALDMINSVDADGNKEIAFEEFTELMKSRVSNDPDYELRLAFDTIDTDGSGTISIKELRDLMIKVNQQLSDDEIDSIMSEVDADGNKELNFDEFKMLMVSYIALIPRSTMHRE